MAFGELLRSQVCRTQDEVFGAFEQWKVAMLEKVGSVEDEGDPLGEPHEESKRHDQEDSRDEHTTWHSRLRRSR